MNNNLIKWCFRNIISALLLLLHLGMYHIVLTNVLGELLCSLSCFWNTTG